MKLHSLTTYNFGIYKGEQHYILHDKDVVGILAEYANDKARSNRSGKTLWMEAILFGLTGNCRAKKKQQLIHQGEKVMWVNLVLVDEDGQQHIIKRGVDHKGTGSLECDWTQKTGDGVKAIYDLTGASKDDFELTNFFKQSDINGFMDMGASKKTEFLMKWMDNTHWTKREEMAKAKRNTVDKSLSENSAVKKALEASMEIDEALEIELNQFQKKLIKLEEISEETNEKKEKVLTKKRALIQKGKNLLRDAKSIEVEIKEVGTKMGQITLHQTRIKELTLELEELEGYIVKVSSKRDTVISEIADTRSNIKRAKELMERMDSAGGVCPVTSIDCDLIKSSKGDRREQELYVVSQKEKLKELIEEKDKHERNNDLQEDIESRSHAIKVTKGRIEAIDTTDNRDELNKEMDRLREESKVDTSPHDELLTKIHNKIDLLDDKKDEVKMKMGEYNNRISNAKKALERIDEVSTRNEELRTELEELNYVVAMVGKKGIPADEIENAFHEVNDNINYILKELDCGLSVQFSPDRETAGWEPICLCGHQFVKGTRTKECPECGNDRRKKRIDELSLKVLENGEEKDFSLDSGGGKTIVSYAVRIALTMLKMRQNKCKLKVLFLDEVDSALDAHLAGQIINSITKVLTKRLGFDQIFLVSHKEEIKESVPHVLKVTRFDSHSTAEFI